MKLTQLITQELATAIKEELGIDSYHIEGLIQVYITTKRERWTDLYVYIDDFDTIIIEAPEIPTRNRFQTLLTIPLAHPQAIEKTLTAIRKYSQQVCTKHSTPSSST
jgi:hypothetical protein